MNEKDLEQRLRSVTEGRPPSAPATLRQFLREMPEKQAARHAGHLGWLRRIGDGVVGTARVVFAPAPMVARARMGAAVAIALIISLVGAQMFVTFRAAQQASHNQGQCRGCATPPHDHPYTPPPLIIKTNMGVTWQGASGVANENEALPTSAVAWPGGGYKGVSVDPYGQNGLVHSKDGLYWDWSPPSVVDQGVTLTSIASDGSGRTVVSGYAQGIDGTFDGRIYYSNSVYDFGRWQSVNESAFGGTPVQVVVHGPAGFVALGWNTESPASLIRPVMEWTSKDGQDWTRLNELLPIKGDWAYLTATPSGFLLSGTPISNGAPTEVPIWYSTDGTNWQRSTTTDNSAKELVSMISATAGSKGFMLGVCTKGDGMVTLLMQSRDYGQSWSTVDVSTDGGVVPQAFVSIASMGIANDSGPYIAVNQYSGDHIYMSRDKGQHWQIVQGDIGRPLASLLVPLGDTNQSDTFTVLAISGGGMGIWVAKESMSN